MLAFVFPVAAPLGVKWSRYGFALRLSTVYRPTDLFYVFYWEMLIWVEYTCSSFHFFSVLGIELGASLMFSAVVYTPALSSTLFFNLEIGSCLVAQVCFELDNLLHPCIAMGDKRPTPPNPGSFVAFHLLLPTVEYCRLGQCILVHRHSSSIWNKFDT